MPTGAVSGLTDGATSLPTGAVSGLNLGATSGVVSGVTSGVTSQPGSLINLGNTGGLLSGVLGNNGLLSGILGGNNNLLKKILNLDIPGLLRLNLSANLRNELAIILGLTLLSDKSYQRNLYQCLDNNGVDVPCTPCKNLLNGCSNEEMCDCFNYIEQLCNQAARDCARGSAILTLPLKLQFLLLFLNISDSFAIYACLRLSLPV